MLGFVKNMFGGKTSPIGIDFGSDSLKMAQAVFSGGEWRLQAAASADVPANVRHDPVARLNFFCDTTKDLLVQGNFQGRQAVLALPAASMFIQHLRMPKLDEESLKKAIPWEARGKLPIDPHHALLRHHIAGEVFQEQEAKIEVILMAAGRDIVNQLLAAAARAKLEVQSMNVEAKAIIDCFCHIYRRKNEAEITSLYVDMGATATRAFIARGTQMLFARSIPIGGDQFTRTIAGALNMNMDEAKLMRLKLASMQAPAAEAQPRHEVADAGPVGRPEPEPEPEDDPEGGFALLGAALAAAQNNTTRAPQGAPAHGGGGNSGPARVTPAAVDRPNTSVDLRPASAGMQDLQSHTVERIMGELAQKIVGELDMCRRYYEATFPNKPVDRLVFIGGEAKNRSLCTAIAREMGLAAQVGDPLVRMGRVSEIAIESGIDRRQPQPNWAVAIGLSMGPVAGSQG